MRCELSRFILHLHEWEYARTSHASHHGTSAPLQASSPFCLASEVAALHHCHSADQDAASCKCDYDWWRRAVHWLHYRFHSSSSDCVGSQLNMNTSYPSPSLMLVAWLMMLRMMKLLLHYRCFLRRDMARRVHISMANLEWERCRHRDSNVAAMVVVECLAHERNVCHTFDVSSEPWLVDDLRPTFDYYWNDNHMGRWIFFCWWENKN